MKAQVVPFSSTVGQSIMLLSESDACIGMLSLHGVNPSQTVIDKIGEKEAIKLHYQEMARCVADAINGWHDLHTEPSED